MEGEIHSAEVSLLAIDMRKPFQLGFGTLHTLPRVILCLETVGRGETVVGYGEGSIDFPYVPYDAWDIFCALQSLELVGRSIEDRENILADGLIGRLLAEFPAARAALNMALDDLAGRYFKTSLAQFYGRQHDATRALVSLPFFDSVNDCLAAMQPLLDDGMVVKFKAGNGVRKDVDILSGACLSLLEQGLFGVIDFNASYSSVQFGEFVERMHERDSLLDSILFLEQPTRVEDGVEGLIQSAWELRNGGVRTPLMADESLETVRDGVRLNEAGVLLNYKIQKVGGMVAALQIESALPNNSLPAMVGGTFPTAIGRAYDQHAATLLRSASLPSNAWTPTTQYFSGQRHLIEERFIRNPDGGYAPFSGPGLGVTVNEDRLKKYRLRDPLAEYRRIRSDLSGDYLRMDLPNQGSYRSTYEQKSGRPADWNLT